MNKEIEPIHSSREKVAKLKLELERARRVQLEAEAELAQEQAAVNAFRMHCRLKLDDLVDSLMDLRAEKQACLTQMELLRQGIEPAWLEEDEILSKDWWCLVQSELGQAVDRLKREVTGLKAKLEGMERKSI
jgi:hypothetical protein